MSTSGVVLSAAANVTPSDKSSVVAGGESLPLSTVQGELILFSTVAEGDPITSSSVSTSFLSTSIISDDETGKSLPSFLQRIKQQQQHNYSYNVFIISHLFSNVVTEDATLGSFIHSQVYSTKLDNCAQTKPYTSHSHV